MFKQPIIFILICVAFITACQPAPPEVSKTVTQASAATATIALATDIPTEAPQDPTATVTLIPTLSETSTEIAATNTPIAQADSEAAVASTTDNTVAPEPSVTPTEVLSTEAATASPLPITATAVPATVTLAPTATPEPQETLLINNFTVSPNAAFRGDSVTLAWDVTGATFIQLDLIERGQTSAYNSATLRTLNGYGDENWLTNDTPSADIEVGGANQNTFVLTARDDAGNENSATVIVTLSCRDEAFFSAENKCGAEPPTQRNAAYQQFQNGAMIWLEGWPYIVVIQNGDVGSYGALNSRYYADNWNSSLPEDATPDQPAPAGCIKPLRGFGLLHANNATVRNVLGCAIGGETFYSSTNQYLLQKDFPGGVLGGNTADVPRYYALPNGGLFTVKGLPSG